MSSPWAYYRLENLACEICGDQNAQVHHIVSRGRKGKRQDDNSRTNLITLCVQHHTECHSLGRKRFPAKYGLEARWERAFDRTLREAFEERDDGYLH